MNCVLPNDNYTFQYWVNPSNEYFNVTKGQFRIIEVGNNVFLKVFNSTTSDSGTYSCFISKY